jgi:hypothetical protein
MNNKRTEILIPYYYDADTDLLYNSKQGGNSVRTQFFSEEQTKALHKQEKEIKKVIKPANNSD